MSHLLFQENLVGEDVPKGISVPFFEVLLKKLQLAVKSMHAGSSCDLGVQPPASYHLMKVRVSEPKFLKPKGFSFSDIINLPIKRNWLVVRAHSWEDGRLDLIISEHYVF